MKKPRIVIPEINQNIQNYMNAVRAAGMEPVAVSLQSEQLPQTYQQEYLDYSEMKVEDYDGLLLPGGGDINPVRYGQENQGSTMVVDALDKLQFAVLDDFVKSGKPVFGICRGHQVINVYFGGTLIQHLPTSFRHARRLEDPDKVHRCLVNQGSWLAEIYGTEFFHNSAHHQAVDRFGENLVPDSYCPEDGTVEAMHHSILPVYSVQWHPERMCLAWEREDTVNGLPALQFFSRVCMEKMEKRMDDTDHGIVGDRMGL